jgi:hypothetical protein
VFVHISAVEKAGSPESDHLTRRPWKNPSLVVFCLIFAISPVPRCFGLSCAQSPHSDGCWSRLSAPWCCDWPGVSGAYDCSSVHFHWLRTANWASVAAAPESGKTQRRRCRPGRIGNRRHAVALARARGLAVRSVAHALELIEQAMFGSLSVESLPAISRWFRAAAAGPQHSRGRVSQASLRTPLNFLRPETARSRAALGPMFFVLDFRPPLGPFAHGADAMSVAAGLVGSHISPLYNPGPGPAFRPARRPGVGTLPQLADAMPMDGENDANKGHVRGDRGRLSFPERMVLFCLVSDTD